MNQQQREQRHAANQAFLDSLEQLQTALQKVNNTGPCRTDQPDGADSSSTEARSPEFDLHKFEQAAQDIEEFFQRRQQE